MNIFRFQKLVILNKVKDLREVRDSRRSLH